ncbi:MAG: KpsF/GutQ family sugar-phosphate isomerase [Deltaproteobacteria bacterium]|nr:KpsF/GutQ family sugar-phosphate isomerase [Deltaproteobacteria bacterium]
MVIEQAKQALEIEVQAISRLITRIGEEFQRAVDLILASKGRVILTGMGKSGFIARKISATLNSTGTPSLFLHPAEAAHGDLGMVTGNDIVLAISNSGQTVEILSILPTVRSIGAPIVAFTGGLDSQLARDSDVVIDVSVENEACPMGVTPTASTTAALAMGDALAVALIHCRRFNRDDFKKFHPGGTLGERLSVKVKSVMLTEKRIPVVALTSQAKDAISEIDDKKVGAVLVIDNERKLIGIITDGDLRRTLLRQGDIYSLDVKDIMSPSPKTIDENKTAAKALEIMEQNGITHLAVTDKQNRVKGLVHLHDILGREALRFNGNATTQ